ncbi:MAG: cupin domain-containing protein [Acidimicrobiales bacterium]
MSSTSGGPAGRWRCSSCRARSTAARHPRPPVDEVYIGVAGEVEVTVGEDHTVLHAGDVVAVAAGRLHAFRVLTDGARMYVITSGHRASSFFADLDADVGAVAPDPTTLPGVVAVARRHGLTSPLFG